MSDAADPLDIPLDILAINVSGAAASDTITLPSLPAQVTDSAGFDVGWMGNGSDAVTCLPLSTITFEIIYRCSNSPIDNMVTFNLTDVLADAIP